MPLIEEKNITVNRKATYDYFIKQTYEAGISLVGTEVKALRQHKANLTDSYATIRSGEVILLNCTISAFENGNINNHDPVRERKLLLNKSEIKKISRATNDKGATIIPLRLYFKGQKVKVELGIAFGKKSYDKREDIATREIKREIARNLKR
ncbi:SsrA-binding protein [bacterium BRH_c32]|nr:MAG: SsrA-binding protein [bacterium BRH_c32]